MKKITLALLLCLLASPSFAQTAINPCLRTQNAAGNVNCSPQGAFTGVYNTTGITVGASSALALAAGQASIMLDVINDSAANTIACCFGSSCTAVINGAGSVTIPPLWHRSWENNLVPSDQMNCIASGAGTPVTLGVK